MSYTAAVGCVVLAIPPIIIGAIAKAAGNALRVSVSADSAVY